MIIPQDLMSTNGYVNEYRVVAAIIAMNFAHFNEILHIGSIAMAAAATYSDHQDARQITASLTIRSPLLENAARLEIDLHRPLCCKMEYPAVLAGPEC